ncbi:hypothetical protein GCM10022237_37670 [Nocardioides ginsengisoli]|uniref:CARDB domain-containing protein n=1 Tax=Nocardioides ginsengisoli TaxID=363868 RepID=A0ABW3VWW9_9ACTN
MQSRIRACVVTSLSALVAGGILVAPDADAAAARRPDLKVVTASVSTTRVVENATLTIKHTVKNVGKAKAKASTTQAYLTRDPAASLAERKASRTNPRSGLADIPLQGAAGVKTMAPRGKVAVGATSFRVPVGTPAGSYAVLVCADDRGVVTESNEANNCAAAGGRVAVSAAPGTEKLTLQSFADAYTWPDDESGTVDDIRLFCKSLYPARALSLTAAIAGAEQSLKSQAGAGVLDQLARSGKANTVEAAQELAATATLAGRPGLALASLLRAYRLEPANGTHLVNAAAVATAIGLPNEALAFLDAAATRGHRRTPLAIPQQASALVVRGQALLMTGRTAAAESAYRTAKALAPILSEADAGLATVKACAGDRATAGRFARRARQRSDKQVPVTPPPGEQVRPAPSVDLGQGRATPLRQLILPETPAQGVRLNGVYQGIQDGFGAEIDERNAEEDDLRARLRDGDADRTRAEIDRRDGIFDLAYGVGDSGPIKAAADAYDDAQDELVAMREAFFGGGTGEVPYTYGELSDAAFSACAGSPDRDCVLKEMNRTCRPALTHAHTAYRTKLAEAQTLANTYFQLYSTKVSAYAANLSDPDAYRFLLLQIPGVELGTYEGLVNEAQAWTHFENLYRTECVEPLPDVVTTPVPDPSAPAGAGGCPDLVKRISFKFALGPSSVKVNCESVQQSYSTEVLPLLNAFVEVKYSFRSGGLTVVAGVKGGGKIGNVVDAGFKSGIYVTSNGRGEISDAGWRVGPSVSAIHQELEVSAYKDEIDISFLPVLSTAL